VAETEVEGAPQSPVAAAKEDMDILCVSIVVRESLEVGSGPACY